MNVLLVYYTGTYNTRYLTNKVKERFTSRGDTVTTVEINRKTPVVSTAEYDLVGFSYPIYGFNSPAPFNRYVKKLRMQKGQRFFIYKNSGETFAMNNASSRILLRRMKRQKAVFAGEYHFVMPYNIHFRFDDDFVREILAKNQKQLDVMMANLDSGKVETRKSKAIYNVAAAVVGIQKIGGPINSFFYRVNKDKCVKCNLCVKTCPQQNIYQNKKGKIKFHHRCDMCMRCSFFCPTDAISIGLLKGWKINGAYPLAKFEKQGAPETPYITKNSEGFYKCFPAHFQKIDDDHKALFEKDE